MSMTQPDTSNAYRGEYISAVRHTVQLQCEVQSLQQKVLDLLHEKERLLDYIQFMRIIGAQTTQFPRVGI
jgi:hypothetical protein